MLGSSDVVLLARRSRVALVATALAGSLMVPLATAGPAQAVTTASTVTATTAAARSAASPSRDRLESSVSTTKAAGAKRPDRRWFKPKRILEMARRFDGGYYRSGGTSPSGFDCSGYTMYVFKKLGRSLPHNSGAQYGVTKKVSRANARKGDLIFFRGSGGIYHVGIFAGGGKLYHASTPGRRTGLGPIFSSNVVFARVQASR